MSPWGIERYVEWIFMAIYGKTWVFQQNVKSVLHWKSWQFFSLIKSFQHSFAFLPSWNTMEHWGFLCFRNFLPEKISSQWLSDIRNFQIIPQCTLVSPSIFSVILTYPSRISSVRRVGSSGFFSLDEPRNDPIGFAGYPKMFSIISNIV